MTFNGTDVTVVTVSLVHEDVSTVNVWLSMASVVALRAISGAVVVFSIWCVVAVGCGVELSASASDAERPLLLLLLGVVRRNLGFIWLPC